MQVYSKLSYTLTIHNGKDGAEDKLRTEGLKGVRLRDLEPGREYCVTARIRDRKSESHSSVPGCAHMPAAYSADVWISTVLSVFVLVVVVALVLLYCTGFICLKASLDALVTVKSQPVSLLPTPYDKVSYSLVLIQSPAPPVARRQKCMYERNSGSEEDSGGEGEDDSGSSAGGYERRPLQDRCNSSSSCPPQAGRHYSVSKVLDCPPDPLPITDTLCGPAVDTPVDSGPPPESRSAPHPEPFAVCLTGNTPLTLTLTGDGSLPLSLTVKGPQSLIRNKPFFMPVAENEPLSVFVTASRPLPVSVTAADPLSALGRTDGPLPQKPGVCVGEDRVGTHGEPAPELQGAGTEEWAEQCINLESVMLAGHGETEEEEGQRGGSMSQEPSLPGVTLEPCGPPPSQTSMLTEPPQMHTCSLQTSEEEEEEPCSGYMRRSNEEQEDEGEEEEPLLWIK
ncbi:hypothetical protein AGOR_G00220470 [Albula goreensis]|uniref:Interferon/interleukin receptor domain-containing protein n=1 Tax=Albula goreensis TaxID=1534307 RepID=A0A8T3CQ98_9TELE|nr:hypothetical protein AGOR_G00220470 [Albula goreensis]